MFTATKIETEILKLLGKKDTQKSEPIEFEEQQIIEEICKTKEKDSAVTTQIIQNALEGCIAKGFAAQASGGIKITDEGKRQI